MNKISDIDSLVFEGGGVKGLAYIEFIRVLNKKYPFFLENIQQYAGSSIGAIFSALLAIDTPIDKIEYLLIEMLELSGREQKKTFCCIPKGCLPISLVYNFFYKFGLLENKNIQNQIRKWFTSKNNKDIYFKDLSKRLVITAVNLNTHKIVFFSNELTPNVPLYKAVAASMCIPYLFEPILYDFNPDIENNNHLLIDGGAMIEFPIKVFDDKDPYDGIHSLIPNNNVLGIRLDDPLDIRFMNSSNNAKITNIGEFIIQYNYTMSFNCKFNIRDDERTCSIITKEYDINELGINDTILSELFHAGKLAAEKYISEVVEK